MNSTCCFRRLPSRSSLSLSMNVGQAARSRCSSSSSVYLAYQKQQQQVGTTNSNVAMIDMQDYSYELREESIAKYPASPRGNSRLLHVDSNGTVTHYDNFSKSFVQLLGTTTTTTHSHLVLNETRVAPARLQVMSSSSKFCVEMLLLVVNVEQQQLCDNMELKVMIRKEHVQPGDMFTDPILGTNFIVISSDAPWQEEHHHGKESGDDLHDGNGTECTVRCILPNTTTTLQQLLNAIGTVPIPPYLHRKAEESDAEAYNTVYAKQKQQLSVAAPTAGLHFTDEVLGRIGVEENITHVSLHVGAGTFKPVLVRNALDHAMHSEQFSISKSSLKRIINALQHGKSIIAVGTTTCRTLESLYWCGVRRILGDDEHHCDLSLKQMEWHYYMGRSMDRPISNVEALSSLLVYDHDDDHALLYGNTSLMIVPQLYQFKVVDHLVTNFHAPDSTLLLLISAFLGGGENVKRIYQDAQERGYRFLSYGDVCMFSRKIN